MPLTLDDFDYALPPELIAQFPAPERSASRLLRLSGETLSDRRFSELPQFLHAGDVLVLNDTRVIKARLYGAKASGGRIEALVERVTGAREALAQTRASHAPRPGTRLTFDAAIEAEVLERRGDLYLLRFGGSASVFELLDGSVPCRLTHAEPGKTSALPDGVRALGGATAAPGASFR